jgi:hypothetical protein
MSAATITNPGELVDELCRFEPVSDAVVLAAIDRAERHRGGTGEGARMSNLAEHLGFVHGPWTAGSARTPAGRCRTPAGCSTPRRPTLKRCSFSRCV